CPVNGPQVAALGDTVAVAWFSAPEGTPARVQLAISTNGGATFGTPSLVSDEGPVGRVAVVMSPDGPIVSWLERANGEAADVRLRRYDWNGGALDEPLVVHTGSAARSSGFPRMTWAGDAVIL